jgi:hypothetical protein
VFLHYSIVAVVFGVVIHGIETTGKVFLSQFFCVSPSNVLAHRRRFEQLIVAQVHDALRFSAQRNTPASLFVPLDLASTHTDLLADAAMAAADGQNGINGGVGGVGGGVGGSASAVLPTAVSVERGETNAGSGGIGGSGPSGVGGSGGTSGSSSGGGVGGVGSSVGTAVANALLGGGNSGASGGAWSHTESGAFALDLSLCDSAERSWLAEVALERRRDDFAGVDAEDLNNSDDIDTDPRLFVFWRAIHATCFTVVCDEVDNRQLAAQWLDVMARMIAEHFRNPNVLQTPDVLLSQPAELHVLLHQLLPSGQLLHLTDTLAKLLLRNSEQTN